MTDDRAERLIGTWKLLAVVSEDVATGEKSDFFGPNPMGYIIYTPEGRMMVINVRGDRPLPTDPSPTPEEAVDLFRSVLAYGGEYTVEGDEVTHHVDISWNEVWTGTKQTRTIRFDGDRVHLSTKPNPDPVSGRMSVRTMTWEKMK